MASLGLRYVPRPRLTALLAERPVGVVEARAGFGKSVLASQYRQTLGIASAYVPLGPPDRDPEVLVGSLRRALAGARLSDLLAVTGEATAEKWIERLLDGLWAASEAVLLVLDDAHHLTSTESADIVLRLASGLPAHHRLLVNARSFARQLEPLWRLPDAVSLDSAALAFTMEEARELVHAHADGSFSEHGIRVLLEATGGWATALVLAATAGHADRRVDGRADGDGGDRLLQRGDPVAVPLQGILDTLDDRDRSSIIELSHLPLLSTGLCDRVGGRTGFFEWMISRGIPLTRSDSGWWEMPSPVCTWLSEQAAVSPAVVLAAADEYERLGARLAALRLLVATGAGERALARLASMGMEEVEGLGLGVVRDLLGSLPESAVNRNPRVLLHLARLAETAHESGYRAEVLERALACVRSEDAAPDLVRELEAERARDLMWDERTRADARALATSVLERAEEGEVAARARALDLLGRLASWFSSTGPQPEAEALLRESAELARSLGQSTWTAQALVALGGGYLFALCRFESALGVLDEALGELPARNQYRAMVQSFRVDTLVELERWEEAEAGIAEMRDIGEAVREPWILAYAAWSEAQMASYLGDTERCLRAAREIDRHPGDWLEQPSGGECLAQVADHLSRVGQAELARQFMDRAQARMEGNERIVRVHGAAVLARVGDPLEAEAALAAALEGAAAEPQELWPIRLLQAHVALRLGDPVRAGQVAAVAFDYCRGIGHQRGPLIRERRLAEPLLTLAAEAGSAVAQELLRAVDRDTWSVRLLGVFQVSRNGTPIELPTGLPAKLVRIVAALRGRVHLEALIEFLWPHVGLVAGRNRLRNLMSRIRAEAGDLLLREAEMVVLNPRCELDAERFEAGALEALRVAASGHPRGAVVLARTALGRYHGDVLPDDAYEDWARPMREELRSLRLELLDLLAATAEHDGEIDEAIRLRTQAVETQPHDESRYLQLAGLLASQGRVGSALGLLDRAAGVLAAAGVAAGPDLTRLRHELRAVHGDPAADGSP